MNAAQLLQELRNQGVRLENRGKRLYYRGPENVITPELLETLRKYKGELLNALRELRDWNHLPSGPPTASVSDAFTGDHLAAIRAGRPVPVWSSVLGEWLWWVKDETTKERLQVEGCTAPIYTLGELSLVAGWDADALRDVHAIKKTFGSVIEAPPGAAS